MSGDEVIVTMASVVIGPVLWAAWLIRMAGARRLHSSLAGLAALAVALAVCAVLIFTVMRKAASSDVVNAPQYLFMYVVLGLAWMRLAAALFPFVGLSPRDDVVERRNAAA